jgi:hypothetical protein
MQPHKLGGGENERPRPSTRSPVYTGNRSSGRTTHRLHTEAYEYCNSMSNTVPPAGEYLRAPVCCSECEYFWKALILEVDEKHTSREPAGKASLVLAKGATGSVLQIKSTKHVAKERRFFPGLGCKSSTAASPSVVGSKPSASRNTTSAYTGHEYYPSYSERPSLNQPDFLSSVSRQWESLPRSAVGYGAAPKHDVISTPRRHGHIPHTDRPRSAVYPQSTKSSTQTRRSDQYFSSTSPEANQAHDHHVAHPDLKPIRTRFDTSTRRPVEKSSHLSTHAPILADQYADSFSQLKPFPRANSSLYEKVPSSRATQPREFLSYPSTARMFTPRGSPLPENRVEEFLRRKFPPRTPGSRWDTQNHENQHTSGSPGASPLRGSGQGKGIPGRVSRTSTIESDYTYLSISGSDWSGSSSDSQDRDSPTPSPRAKLVDSRSHQELLRNGADNLSRTWTPTSSLMEPIVLFTGHGCRSETDENSEDELDDAVVTNPNYFKHIKHVVKPHAATPTEQVAKG